MYFIVPTLTLIAPSVIISLCECLDVFAELNTRPNLRQLNVLKGNGQTVRVIDMAAAVWDKVADVLGFESYDISRIRTNNPQQCELALRNVFVEWIQGKGRQPKTWLVLIEALKEAKLESVARKLKCVLGMPYIDF